jgi:hypothetical protein
MPAISRTGHDTRVDGAIRVVREGNRNDGADGESAHLVCDEVERLREQLDRLRDVRDAARKLRVSHTTTCDDRPVCICGLNNLRDALDAYDLGK